MPVTSTVLGGVRISIRRCTRSFGRKVSLPRLPDFISEMVPCTDGTPIVHLANDADKGTLRLCGPWSLWGFLSVGAIAFPFIEEDTEGLKASGLCPKHLEQWGLWPVTGQEGE